MPLVLRTIKLVVGGDGGVGKTSILYRFINNSFMENIQMTIGVQLQSREVEWNGSKITLVFWDLSGQERFRFVLPSYCNGASGAFILFDMSDTETLARINEWFDLFRRNLPPGAPIVFVGTKMDLVTEEQAGIINDAAIKFCQAYGAIAYVPTSSKTGQNVNNVVEYMMDALMKNK
jgi:small GTP-binding protein